MNKHYYNKIITNSADETKKLAMEFAKRLTKYDTVIFIGNLGSGKTTFISGIGKYFGINNIKSPTFTIANRYLTNKGFFLYHIDLYRIKGELTTMDIDLYEYIENGLALIEWGEIIKNELDNFYEINIKYISENKREISIEYISV